MIRAARLDRHPHRPHAILLADRRDHAEHNRVQLKVLVGVDMVEREPGAAEQIELCGDFAAELAARVAIRHQFECQPDHVAPEAAILVGKLRDLVGAKGTPPFDQNQMEAEAQPRHRSGPPHGISGGGSRDHEAGGGQNARSVSLLDRLIDLRREAEIIRRDDEPVQRRILARPAGRGGLSARCPFGSERSAMRGMINIMSPMYGTPGKARNVYGEGEDVAQRDHPERMGRELEPALDGETKGVFACEGRAGEPKSPHHEGSAKQRQDHRVGDDRSGKAGRVYGAHRSCPAKFVEP